MIPEHVFFQVRQPETRVVGDGAARITLNKATQFHQGSAPIAERSQIQVHELIRYVNVVTRVLLWYPLHFLI